MATFRDIDQAMLDLIDPETGELLDAEAFERLEMERTEKAQGMGLWALDLADEEDALDREIARLTERRDACRRKRARLLEYLQIVLHGEKLKTPKITISYRSSSSVQVTDDALLREFAQAEDGRYESILRYREPEISKTEVKRLIAEGVAVPGAEIVQRISTVIK